MTVDAPGGHVYQSRGLGATTGPRSGWRPRFLVTADGGRVLALERAGRSSVAAAPTCPAGRSPAGRRDDGRRPLDAIEVADALAGRRAGSTWWPRMPRCRPRTGYGDAIRAAGFRPIEEIQPSRHRIALPLGRRATRTRVLAGDREVDAPADPPRPNATRSSSSGTTGRPGRRRARRGLRGARRTGEVALDRFYDLLLETGERRALRVRAADRFVAWWTRAMRAGHLVYLEAAARRRRAARPLAGLVLYRHGGRLSTVHSGDHARPRRDPSRAPSTCSAGGPSSSPSARAARRWTSGASTSPGRGASRVEGEPMYGLYQHKRSFGGRWVELTGAHERVIRRRGLRARPGARCAAARSAR